MVLCVLQVCNFFAICAT